MAHSPPFVMNLFRTVFIGWSQVQRRPEQFLFLPKNICWPPSRGGQPPKKWEFKVLGIICCGYSKLVSQDAWHNAKGIRSIRSPCSEKTSKTCSFIGIFWCWLKTAKSDHILDVFSGQGDRIEPIPFALCQASQDKSLEYQQHIIPRTLNFHFLGGRPPLEGGQKMFFGKNKNCYDLLWTWDHPIKTVRNKFMTKGGEWATLLQGIYYGTLGYTHETLKYALGNVKYLPRSSFIYFSGEGLPPPPTLHKYIHK